MTDAFMPAPRPHPDVEIVEAKTGFERFLRMEVFRFRHRLYSGGWSPIRTYDVLGAGRR